MQNVFVMFFGEHSVSSVVNPTSGVRYIQLGRLVVVSLDMVVSGVTGLGAPATLVMFPVVARSSTTGDMATFWINNASDGKLTLQVYKATGYTQGENYVTNFAYIASNSS